MKKAPKTLEMNPLTYGLTARVVDSDDLGESAHIEVSLGEAAETLNGYINKKEAEALSKWFAQLAEAIK